MAGLSLLHSILPISERLNFEQVTQQSQSSFASIAPFSNVSSVVRSGILLSVDIPAWVTESMLFQAAISHASHCNVLYISTHKLQVQPAGIFGMPHASPVSLSNVKFLYMEEVETLLDFLASAHELQFAKKFELVVIDELDWFVERLAERDARRRNDTNVLIESARAKLCSMIVDSASYLLKRRHGSNEYGETNLIAAASLSRAKDWRVYSRFVDQLVQVSYSESAHSNSGTQSQGASNMRISYIDLVDLRADSTSAAIRCEFSENIESGERSISVAKNECFSQSQ